MARDFRPKAAREAAKANGKGKAETKSADNAESLKKQVQSASKKQDDHAGGDVEEQDSDVETGSSDYSSTDDEDDETLLREIKALGGDESDLKLITREKISGKDDRDDDDETVDPKLNREVLEFMRALDYKGAGVQAPSFDVKVQKQRNETEVNKNKANATKESTKAGPSTETAPALIEKKGRQSAFVVTPTPEWISLRLPELSMDASDSIRKPSNSEVERLHAKANNLLNAERAAYTQLTSSGKTGAGGPGLLGSSDAKFINDLLAPGARGGTLSDRVAALTMLAQTSPLHNADALDRLLDMASKKGREESGRATRALGDWLASPSGLPERKLRYFRDHATLATLIRLDGKASTLSADERQSVDMHLALIAFEDKLKRFYFDYLKLLERQSHDTVPFVRKQALTQIFVLLKEKSEQEQNLLRLLVNKLGDLDRGVASKASSHLLSLLNTHPAMKAVVSDEVSNLVMRAPSALSRKSKTTGLAVNPHAQYYGVLTLNQTMLTQADEQVANRLVTLYFSLFEGLLHEMTHNSGGKEEDPAASDEENGGKSVAEGKPRRDKGRWRDGKRGKAGKGKQAQAVTGSAVVQDADARIMAAILAGVRRALPFAKIDRTIIEKHMDTLFRITHSSTFNISIQALQLIFQVCSIGHQPTSATAAPSSAKGTLQDRYYRTLYASMLDKRLRTTSKQAMYLNLLFKSVKQDQDDGRTKAFVKRLVQILDNSEPPFICGSLFLLGELFIAKPSLRNMLNESEDDGEEHFADVPDDVDEAPSQKGNHTLEPQAAQAATKTTGYDGVKREPRYAHADDSCLWELVPLMAHFHPSVALCAAQLLTAQRINTTADLTLHTLSHFLDRFVYRNPKKRVAPSKGESLMQPALHANDTLEAGVVRLRGKGITKDEFVNSDKFWRKKARDVPVDQLFFHKFFNLRNASNAVDASAANGEDDDDAEERENDLEVNDDQQSGQEDDDVKEGSSDEEDSEMEKEIWEAMKKSMPRERGDDLPEVSEEEEDDDDDEINSEMMASSGDEGQFNDDDDDEDDLSENAFEEDEEDLLPFDFPGEEGESDSESDQQAASSGKGKNKRKAEGEEEEQQTTKSKSQLRREQRKKHKAMPTFATADAYAHLLGKSDDEDDDQEEDGTGGQ